MHQVRNRVADPLWRGLSLLYWVSDVLPGEFEAQVFEIVRCDDDLADFVLEVRRTHVEEVSSHCGLSVNGALLRGPWRRPSKRRGTSR